jgi:hypothetical protein
MGEEILQFTSDEDSWNADDLDPSYDSCPEDMKLNVR